MGEGTTESGYPPAGGSTKEVPKRESARPTDSAKARATPRALTVAEVVTRIRGLIEQAFPTFIWVEGEVSNCSFPASGHIYFSLVDERATDRLGQRLVLPCAFFRNANQRLKFKLENGLKVLCDGDVTTYEAKGTYQLRVLRVEPKGIGALQLAFDQLKRRLGVEGLFDEQRKRPIPRLPERVGLVTSSTGSVIHDMVARLRGRIHVIILPVKVQGDGAADEIAEAIRLANARRLADVLIVGRGGGSLEELWAFNEECVARAIYHSAIPVISAVGHEDHWTIADYVADLRASTPTHAAQLLVEERQALVDQTNELVQQLADGMAQFLDEHTERVQHLAERLRLLHPAYLIRDHSTRVVQAQTQLAQLIRHTLEREDKLLAGLAGRLQALSPLAVLARGYSITLKLPDRHVVTAANTVRIGDALETRLAHGHLVSTVTDTVTSSVLESNGADA